mmetsp:Transcript_5743/g.16326  ORF Transcript_5743/g.16326 Transcript_5743/m.16326 type:complete len:256 (-) Transcript_5743:1243-2010(-)
MLRRAGGCRVLFVVFKNSNAIRWKPSSFVGIEEETKEVSLTVINTNTHLVISPKLQTRVVGVPEIANGDGQTRWVELLVTIGTLFDVLQRHALCGNHTDLEGSLAADGSHQRVVIVLVVIHQLEGNTKGSVVERVADPQQAVDPLCLTMHRVASHKRGSELFELAVMSFLPFTNTKRIHVGPQLVEGAWTSPAKTKSSIQHLGRESSNLSATCSEIQLSADPARVLHRARTRARLRQRHGTMMTVGVKSRGRSHW